MELLIILVVLFLLMLLQFPIAFCFVLVSFLAALIMKLNLSFILAQAFTAINVFSFMAVPFFVLAGDLMTKGGLSDRLIKLAYVMVHRLRAGLGAVVVLACMFFGALSGSSSAATAAIGSAMIPRMEQYGYSRRYSSALVAVAGWLGNLIPPSVVFIVYGVISNQSIAALFLSTVIPGFIFAALLILVNTFYGPKWISSTHVTDEHLTTDKLASLERIKQLGQGFLYVLPAILAPFIILGGIYGGIFTPTESGAIGCVYALLIGISYRKLNLKTTLQSVYDAGTLLASLFIIVAFVTVITKILQFELVPQKITAFMLSLSDSRLVILVLMNLIFLIGGMFIESFALIVALTPLFIPICQALNINLIHFGAMINVNVGIGTITPPMCMAIFIASRIGGVPFRQLVRPSMPFLFFAGLPTLIIVTYFPEVSLWLPRLVMGPVAVPY